LPKWPKMKLEFKFELLGIILITIAIFSIISLLGANTGPVGFFIARMLVNGFGIGAAVLPVVLFVVGSCYAWTRNKIQYTPKFFGYSLLYICLLAIFHHFRIPVGEEILPQSLIPGGGLLGGFTLFGLRKLFGTDGTIIVLSAISICTVILVFTWSLSRTIIKTKEKALETAATARETIASHIFTEDERPKTASSKRRSFYNQERDTTPHSPLARDLPPEDLTLPSKEKIPEIASCEAVEIVDSGEEKAYSIPPLSLLKKSTPPKNSRLPKEIATNTHILEEMLENFGVGAKIINTCQGPTVTRYELAPAPGVKVSKIVNLADDIALKLAAPGVRIEAPIPGKAAIGIEVPNKDVSSVPLRDVLESSEFNKSSSKLTVALGKDIAGQPIIADLAKMPHLLVAGATGSGKSVCINTLITSILFKATPQEVKLVLIDPKVVELSSYNGIPHLLTPVLTDAKKAAGALRWAVKEMENRYSLFAETGVRDIARYNETAMEERLPLIVIIIDELADLMMIAPVDVEDAICRLAQMARAAGLHLVLATQRPSVDVITGTIKANIPSRISFAVSSQVDSRTILDMGGAEKLLGKGDMLFYPVGSPKPVRVQGAYIGDNEVEDLLTFIKRQGTPEYMEIGVTGEETIEKKEQEKFTDELLEDAVCMVMETGQASVSMLQRKFRIGYTRAARLIDTMEEMHIVGPNIGSKAREIIMTSDQIYARYFNKS